MGSVVIFMLFAFGIGVFVCGTVIVGMLGKGKEQHPKMARSMARAAQALNGDGEPPRGLSRLLG